MTRRFHIQLEAIKAATVDASNNTFQDTDLHSATNDTVNTNILQQQQCYTYQSFSEFQSFYGKKAASTNRQLFGHQLRQIQGCSTGAALALMSKYGTTANFMDSLKLMGPTKAEV